MYPAVGHWLQVIASQNLIEHCSLHFWFCEVVHRIFFATYPTLNRRYCAFRKSPVLMLGQSVVAAPWFEIMRYTGHTMTYCLCTCLSLLFCHNLSAVCWTMHNQHQNYQQKWVGQQPVRTYTHTWFRLMIVNNIHGSRFVVTNHCANAQLRQSTPINSKFFINTNKNLQILYRYMN